MGSSMQMTLPDGQREVTSEAARSSCRGSGLCAQWAGDALPPVAEYPVWIDVDQTMICDHFGEAVGTLPVHLLVTGDGTVQSRIVGALPADMADRINDWL